MNYQVSIEPRFLHSGGVFSFLKIQKSVIVQSDVFKLGFKITNIGQSAVRNLTVRNIAIRPTDGTDLVHSFKKEFIIDLLNPKESKEIWVSDFGTDIYGLAQVTLSIVADNDIDVIEAYQVNRFNSDEDKSQNNSWLDFFYIKSSHEHVQERTNRFLLLLTVVAAIAAVSPFISSIKENRQVNEMIKYCKEDVAGGSVKFNTTGVTITCEEYLKKHSG